MTSDVRIRSFNTILELIEDVALRYPERIALMGNKLDSGVVNYTDLVQHIKKCAEQLNQSGIDDKSRVAIVLPNGLNMAMTLVAATSTVTTVPLNPNSSLAEFYSNIQDLNVTHIITSDKPPKGIDEVAKQLRLTRLEVSASNQLVVREQPKLPNVRSIEYGSQDSIALILQTSGSTGRPKKVPLSHKNILVSVGDICESLQLTADDTCLCMWEQYHIGGLVDLLLAPLAVGGKIICTPGFDGDDFYRLMGELRPTWFQGVPTTLYAIVSQANKMPPRKFPDLRFIRSVAAALDPRLMAEVERIFNVPVIQTFGMTEAGPLITTNPLPPATRKPGSVGRSCGPDIRIESLDGKLLPIREVGEVLIKGPNVFRGYEDNPEANANSFRNGWFRTGDTGFLDEEGYLYLSGRLKELINRGGEKISPHEVEQAILEHSAVEQAAVFSVSHKTLGEDIAAALVLKPDQTLDLTTLRLFLAERLSVFKVPSQISQLPGMPLNSVGKIDKLRLARDLEQRMREERTKAKFHPHRHGLDRFLMKAWASELGIDVTSFGIDDNFSYLGGDSLSGLKILMYVEKALSISIPQEIALTFVTVRAMSDALDELGVSPVELEGGEAEIGHAAGQLTVENASAPNEFDELSDFIRHYLRRLNEAETRHNVDMIRKKIFEIATPDELQQIFLKETIFKKYDINWIRKQIAPNVWRFHGKRNDFPASKSVIFGFTGYANVLMTPLYLILSGIDIKKYDLILLMDPSRKHYTTGIEGIGETGDAVFRFLDDLKRDMGYSKAISFGVSAGGLAALCAGIKNNWNKMIAINPDTPMRHPALKSVLDEYAADHISSVVADILVFFSGNNKLDSSAANDVSFVLPQAMLISDDRHFSHNLLFELFKLNELEKFLRNAFP